MGRAAEAATLAKATPPLLQESPLESVPRSSEKKDGRAAGLLLLRGFLGAAGAADDAAGWLLALARPRPVPHSSSSGHISSSCLAAPRSCPPRHEAWQASARPAYTACTVRAARPAARILRRAAPQ